MWLCGGAGAGSGIGRAVTQLLAQQGATVAAVDVNGDTADDTIKSLQGNTPSH